jgi:hypothetical protein
VEASYKQGLVPQKMEQFGIYEEQGMRMFWKITSQMYASCYFWCLFQPLLMKSMFAPIHIRDKRNCLTLLK